jgi:hypothetical protein
LDTDFQLVQVDRLDQKVDHTVFQGADGVVQGRVSGHDDDRNGVVHRANVFGQFQTIHFGHVDVGEAAVDFSFSMMSTARRPFWQSGCGTLSP